MSTKTYPENKRLILGAGDLFVNNEFVGHLSGSVVLNIQREMAYGRGGDHLADQKAVCINEEITLEAELAEFKLGPLRRALGVAAAATADVAVRNVEQITLTGTTEVLFAKAPVTGTVKVFKLDRSKEYTVTTDYTVDADGITRVALGTIASGETVAVEYDYTATGASSLSVGGASGAEPTYELDFVYSNEDDGKKYQVTMFRAVAAPDMGLSFNEKRSGDFWKTSFAFRALMDPTRPVGSQLIRLTEEV